jgi:hypothetical protein
MDNTAYEIYKDLINDIHTNIEDQDEANNITDKLEKLANRFDALVRQGVSQPVFAYGHWVSVEDGLPNYIEGKHYSENVFTTDGINIYVMARCYEEGGWLWGNCYGDIDGDSEIDDDYSNITHWMPLPKLVGKSA